MKIFFFLAKSMGFKKNVTKILIGKKTYNIAQFLYMVQEGIQKYIRMLELLPFMFFVSNQIWLKQLMNENHHHLGHITKLKRKEKILLPFSCLVISNHSPWWCPI
jgi:hypothetical protein